MMSVTIKRTVGSLSALSNISIKMNDVVLQKLAPGESLTFELPTNQQKIKLSTALTSKEFVIEDGQVFDVVRDNRMWILRWLICLAIILTAFLPLFNLSIDSRYSLTFQFIIILVLGIFDLIVPKYMIKRSDELSDRERNWNSY